MTDALAGFTPGFAALLRGAGIDFGVNRGYAAQAGSSGWGPTFSMKDLASQRSSSRPSAANVGVPGASPAAVTTASASPSLWGSYSAADLAQQRTTVDQLYRQYQAAAAVEQERGASVPPAHPSVFSRVMSVLSRPGQAVEGALFGNAARDSAAPPGQPVSGPLASAWAGLSGKEHFSVGQMLKNKGIHNRFATGAGGFVGDVVLDPTSYIGVGIGKHAIEDTTKSIATHEAARAVAGSSDAAEKLAAKLSADVAASSRALPRRELAGRVVAGQAAIDVVAHATGAQAARTARSALATDLITVGMAPSTASRKAIRWLSPAHAGLPKTVAESAPWMTKIMASPDTLKTAIDTTTEKVAAQASENTARQLTELLHANLSQQVSRSVKLRFGGVPIPGSVPIPAAVSTVLGRAAKVDMVSKTLDVFDKAFHTGTRFDNALTVVKAREAGRAQRRIDVGRATITSAFAGVDLVGRRSYMEALATGPPGSLGRAVVRNAAGEDVGDAASGLLADMGAYVDVAGDGSRLLTKDDLNRYLPGKKGPNTKGNYYKLDKSTLLTPEGKRIRARTLPDLIRANGDYLRHVDPAKFLYALHIAVEKGVARDQLGRAVREWGVPLNPGVLVRSPVTGQMQRFVASPAAKELVDKHGYVPIHTGGHAQEASGFYKRHFDGLVFDPEVKRGLLRVIQIADHEEKRGEIIRAYDKVQGMIKKLLTLPVPAFHIRNSFGDFMTGTADNVFGPRGMASYQQALRTLTGLRTAGAPGSVLHGALVTGVDPLTAAAPNPVEALQRLLETTPKAPGAGRRVMRAPKDWPDAPGGYLTDAQLWAAYNHAGLNQGFVLGDLGQEAAIHPNALRPMAALHTSMDKLMGASAARENFFRLAHFIDRLKRSKAPTLAAAAEEAAYYVRKFHFDYTNVTPFEQTVLARVIPFYKWQRFATPLMLQLFFAKPGVILNWQRAQAGISAMAGFGPTDENMLPTADEILPQYFTDAMMYPIYTSARGNNVYMNPGIPSTQVPTSTLGLSGANPSGVGGGAFSNAMSSVSPLIATPFELATGRRLFGGGQIPTGAVLPYLAGRFGGPIPSLQMAAGRQDADTRAYSLATGLGLSENTPGRQAAYLQQLLTQIRAARKKDQFTAPSSVRNPATRGRR